MFRESLHSALSVLISLAFVILPAAPLMAQKLPSKIVVTNIVLVHGAFADGTSWSKVIPLLEAKGYHVVAVQNPLTSLADDVVATKRIIALQDGPVILVGHSRQALIKAGKLLDGPFEEISIPYGEHKIPGYLFLVDDSGKPRPTIIYTNGFDSTTEEAYFVIAAAALRRDYNVIAYDGPGTGLMIREKNIPFRPDWEAVLGPVMDFAHSRSEVDSSKIVLFGYSMGGYLVARTAVSDHRAAALVLNDGVTSFFATYPPLPEFLVDWIKAGRDEEAIPILEWIKQNDTYARWALQNGVWVYGVSSMPEYVRKSAEFSLTAEQVRKIKTPALILEGEDDAVFKGQAGKLASELKSPHKHVLMRSKDGGGFHCHMGAMRLLHQAIFDWLENTLASKS
jgi:pimeloyl-ACP methyl ester carboxylesterase